MNSRFALMPDLRYGYNGQKSHDNIFVLQSEELVYYVATVAVVYDVYRHKQRCYTEHTMEITWYAAYRLYINVRPQKTIS